MSHTLQLIQQTLCFAGVTKKQGRCEATSQDHDAQPPRRGRSGEVGSPKQARVGAPDVTSGEREEWERQKAAWKSTDTTMTKMWATKDGLAAVLESKVVLLETEMKRVKCDEEKNKRARITMGKQLEQLEQEKATMGKSLAQRDAKIKTLEANVAARESDAMNTDTTKPSAEQSGVATMKLCITASCKVYHELNSMRDEFDMEQVLIRNGYPNAAKLHQAMQDYYGRIADYAPELKIDAGRVYRNKGAYFQARVDNARQAPSDIDPQWRKLGETDSFVSSKRLALGEQSVDYAKEVMKGKSGVYYFVPVDHIHVIASDAYSAKAGKWYAKGSHSKLTVVGKTKDEARVNIVLRGQINDRHVLNHGAPVTASSRVRFKFHKEDNVDLPAGNYPIQFAAYAQGWHIREIIESFEVRGTIEVK